MLRRVVLHGALGEEFGGEYSLDIDTAAEAIRALGSQFEGFYARILEGEYRVTRVCRGYSSDLPEEAVTMRLGAADELHVVPVPSGAKRRGVGKIIIGAALTVASLGGAAALGKGMQYGLRQGLTSGGLLSGITHGAVATFGVGLMLGGVSQLLSPTPTIDDYSNQADGPKSFLFNGAVNVSGEGLAVPLAYGTRVRVGSLVVSSGLTNEEVPA